MWSINALCFLLAVIIWTNRIPASTAFTAYMSEDTTTPDENDDANQLYTQSESLNENEDTSIKIKIFNRKLTDLRDPIVGYIPILGQQLASCEPNSKVDINHKNREDFEMSSLDIIRENITTLLEYITTQNHLLTEHLSKLNMRFSENSEVIRDDMVKQAFYDEYFNCVGDCSKPKCLSKSYPESIAQNNLPKNCFEATALNDFNDGVYLLKVQNSDLNPFYAYCAHRNANEKSWMIIQRREDGAVDFNRNWLDYKHGFGDLHGEYWIGLDRLHTITTLYRHELWILLKDHDGDESYAKYSEFSIGSESEGYKLTVGRYSGTAGDSLKQHNKMQFSTYDNDNDLVYYNCAQKHKGGWWFNECYQSFLNGIFWPTLRTVNIGSKINWGKWTDFSSNLKYTHMAIRTL